MTDPSEPIEEPGNLRFLRILVTTLMVVMIGGFLVIVALFVIRFSSGDSSTPALPGAITLPDGTKPMAFTVGRDWYAVVTDDDRILIFDRDKGELRQSISVKTGN